MQLADGQQHRFPEAPAYLDNSQLDALLRRAREVLLEAIPDVGRYNSLGIHDVARAAGLTPQQIRRFEMHNLAIPTYEPSGSKRNRRYSAHNAVVLIATAMLMHEYQLRPQQAVALMQASSGDRQQEESGAAAESVEGAPDSVPLVTPLQRDDREGLQGWVGREVSLVGAAADLVQRVVGARLVLISVLTLLGTRELPPRCVICVRTAAADEAADEAADDESQPSAPGRGAHERVTSLRVRFDAPPGAPARGVSAGESRAYYAFVTPQRHVFQIGPRSSLLNNEERNWYALRVPGGDSYQSADLFLGIPARLPSPAERQEPESRLLSGALDAPTDAVEVAARLFWTSVKIIPDIVTLAYDQVRTGAIKLEEVAENHGLTPIILWLYAHVLRTICPAMDQCDILTPTLDPRGRTPLLEHVASTNRDEMLRMPRAKVSSGQLLSGYAFSQGQPCYIGDVTQEIGQLISYQSDERARAAAAIPVALDARPVAGGALPSGSRPLACVYLCSRSETVQFTPALMRTLEIAANETAEIQLEYESAARVTTRGILQATRPAMPADPDILRSAVRTWVSELATRTQALTRGDAQRRPGAGMTPHADSGHMALVIVGATVSREFQGQLEITDWFKDNATYQAAEAFAQAVDAEVPQDDPRALTLTQAGARLAPGIPAPVPFAPVFYWSAPATERETAEASAFVVIAGANYSAQQVDKLKNLVLERGLNGATPARTERNETVGRILAWVLDVNPALVARALTEHDDLDAIERQTSLIIQRIDACARLLPSLHEFHWEAFEDGNLPRAILTLRSARALEPSDTYVPRHLLDLYLRAGKSKEAVDLVRECGPLEASMPAKWFCLVAQSQAMQGDLDGALDTLSRAFELDPAHPRPYRVRGEVHMSQGKYKEAVNDFSQARRREQQRRDPHTGRILATTLLMAEAQVKAEDLEGALSTCEYLMVDYPRAAKDNILLHQRLLDIRYQLGLDRATAHRPSQ